LFLLFAGPRREPRLADSCDAGNCAEPGFPSSQRRAVRTCHDVGRGGGAIVGKQAGGRVGFFLHVEDLGAAYARMASAGVQFLAAPRTEPCGQVAVFPDIAGSERDLIGPAS
jgi:predicted enzyme related to lactoylglutathione lyase